MSIKLSYSAWQTFKNSGGRAWYLHYDRKLRPNVYKGAFILGDCFDQAIGYLSETKDVDGAVNLFKKKFKSYDTYLGKLDVFTSDKIQWSKLEGNPKDWYDTKAELAIRTYNDLVIPHFKEVVSTQAYIKIENEDGDYIRGYADKIVRWEQNPNISNYSPELDKWNGKVILFDDKFSTMKYSVHDSEQLATYIVAPNLNIEIDGAGYIVVNKKYRTQKKPFVDIKISIDSIDDSVVESIFEGPGGYNETLQKIKLGDFTCNGENCSKPFGCPYKKFCSSGGKDLTGLVYIKDEGDDGNKKGGKA